MSVLIKRFRRAFKDGLIQQLYKLGDIRVEFVCKEGNGFIGDGIFLKKSELDVPLDNPTRLQQSVQDVLCKSRSNIARFDPYSFAYDYVTEIVEKRNQR